MGLSSWIKRGKSENQSTANASKHGKVYYKNKIVHCGPSQFPLENLLKIFIKTTDEGPFKEDVFLVLAFGELMISLPSEQSNHIKLLDSLSKDIVIDYSNYIKAMGSSDNAKFVLWKK